MEILYESKKDISVELEKLCGEWNVYPKRIDRPRSKTFLNKITNCM